MNYLESMMMMKHRLIISPGLRAQMLEVARQFRKESTPSEEILWQALRDRKLGGRKFRRQQSIGPFIVDFYCPEELMVVEVDGPIHDSQRQADKERQELLESIGLRFVRITADDVVNNLHKCLLFISASFGMSISSDSALGNSGDSEIT